MRRIATISGILLPCLTFLLLAGCVAPNKQHSWDLSREEAKQIKSFAALPALSTNDYVRVPDSQMHAAVAMLQDTSFVQLNPTQVAIFAPTLSTQDRGNLQPYLVRGLSFYTPPAYTTVKYDAASSALFIKQATWNGEMFLPYAGRPQPNAFVVWLPHAPEHVYPVSARGGDGVEQGGTDHR